MLERAEAALGFAGLVVHTHRQEAEHIRTGAHGYDVQRAWPPSRVYPTLAGRGVGSGREVDTRRHAIRRFPHSSNAITLFRNNRGAPPRQKTDTLVVRLIHR